MVSIKSLSATFLLFLIAFPLTVQAIAPLILVAGSLAIGVLLGVAGTHFFVVEPIENLLSEQESVTKANIEVYAEQLKADMSNTNDLASDLSGVSGNYAWALAKYTYIKAKQEGKSDSEAINEANQKVYNYYYNVTLALVSQWNSTMLTIKDMASSYNSLSSTTTGKKKIYWWDTLDGGYDPDISAPTTSKMVLGQSWTYYTFRNEVGHIYAYAFVKCTNGNFDSTCYQSQLVDYILPKSELTEFETTLDTIDAEYHAVVDNLATYVSGVNAADIDINETIDPYILASMMNTDYNTTGYYGYTAAELALLGLPTIGLNKTVNVTIGNETYSGYLFTDWDNQTFEINQTYTLPSGYLMYLATDEGLRYVEPGTNFTIVDLRDARTGEKLQNTTVIRYIQHSGDAADLYAELEKLRLLQREYMNMQSTGGGGFSEWWNSLSDSAKLAVVAIGGIAAYALLRKD